MAGRTALSKYICRFDCNAAPSDGRWDRVAQCTCCMSATRSQSTFNGATDAYRTVIFHVKMPIIISYDHHIQPHAKPWDAHLSVMLAHFRPDPAGRSHPVCVMSYCVHVSDVDVTAWPNDVTNNPMSAATAHVVDELRHGHSRVLTRCHPMAVTVCKWA